MNTSKDALNPNLALAVYRYLLKGPPELEQGFGV